jgi:hypothetical protein
MAVSGYRFSAICAHLARGRDAEAASLAAGQLLALWLQDGLIVEVY